jgi:hypothetical protein
MQNSLVYLKQNTKSFFSLLRISHLDVNSSYLQLFFDLAVSIIRFGLVVAIYSYLFSLSSGTILGESFQTVIFSMFFYFWFMNINPRSLARKIQDLVRTGSIQDIFTKPFHFSFYMLASYIGWRLQIFLFMTALGFPLMIYFFGIIPNSDSSKSPSKNGSKSTNQLLKIACAISSRFLFI